MQSRCYNNLFIILNFNFFNESESLKLRVCGEGDLIEQIQEKN